MNESALPLTIDNDFDEPKCYCHSCFCVHDYLHSTGCEQNIIVCDIELLTKVASDDLRGFAIALEDWAQQRKEHINKTLRPAIANTSDFQELLSLEKFIEEVVQLSALFVCAAERASAVRSDESLSMWWPLIETEMDPAYVWAQFCIQGASKTDTSLEKLGQISRYYTKRWAACRSLCLLRLAGQLQSAEELQRHNAKLKREGRAKRKGKHN